MGGEAALRRQARGEKRKRGEAKRAMGQKRSRRRPADQRDRREIKAKRGDACSPANGEARTGTVESRLEPDEPAAHPSDGMADRAVERRRVADQRLDDSGGERERQRERKRHDGETELARGI
jgi:hypothetical protein